MNKTRRNLMKAALATGALGFSGFSAPALAMDAASRRNLAVLLNGSPADKRFAQGVQLALAGSAQAQTLHLASETIFEAPALRAWLGRHQGLRLAGLLDEAGYVLFSMLAQDAGANLLLEQRAVAGQSADALGQTLGAACLRQHDGAAAIAGTPAGVTELAGLVSFVIDI